MDQLTVESVRAPEGGFVVIPNENITQSQFEESVISVTYVEPGTTPDIVVVDLFDSSDAPLPSEPDRTRLTENQTLTAVLYQDTNDNENFKFYDTSSTDDFDRPYVDEDGSTIGDYAFVNDTPVLDKAYVRVNNDTSEMDEVTISSESTDTRIESTDTTTSSASVFGETETPTRTVTQSGSRTSMSGTSVAANEGPARSVSSASEQADEPSKANAPGFGVAVVAVLGATLLVARRR